MTPAEAFEIIVAAVTTGTITGELAIKILQEAFKPGFSWNVKTDTPTIQFTSKISPIPIAEILKRVTQPNRKIG